MKSIRKRATVQALQSVQNSRRKNLFSKVPKESKATEPNYTVVSNKSNLLSPTTNFKVKSEVEAQIHHDEDAVEVDQNLAIAKIKQQFQQEICRIEESESNSINNNKNTKCEPENQRKETTIIHKKQTSQSFQHSRRKNLFSKVPKESKATEPNYTVVSNQSKLFSPTANFKVKSKVEAQNHTVEVDQNSAITKIKQAFQQEICRIEESESNSIPKNKNINCKPKNQHKKTTIIRKKQTIQRFQHSRRKNLFSKVPKESKATEPSCTVVSNQSNLLSPTTNFKVKSEIESQQEICRIEESESNSNNNNKNVKCEPENQHKETTNAHNKQKQTPTNCQSADISIKYEAHSICSYCDKNFLSEEQLVQHLEKCSKTEPSEEPSSSSPSFPSSQDKEGQPSTSSLSNKHNNSLNNCNVNIKIKTEFEHEMEEEEDQDEEEEETEMEFDELEGAEATDPLQIEECEEVEEPPLVIHSDSYVPVVKEDKMLCFVEGCGQLFKWKWKLYKHMMNHAVNYYPAYVNEFKCLCCPKVYPTLSRLKNHMIIHVTENKFVCTAFPPCSKNFHNRSALERHERVHKKRNCKCPICGKMFRLEAHVKSHIRYHKEPRRNSVTLRAKTSNSNLQSGNESVKQESAPQPSPSPLKQTTESKPAADVSHPFTCIICHKSYVFEARLRKHNATEHGLIIV